MSYILDALKRADAERERGIVPVIHTQPPAAWSVRLPRPSLAGRTLWFVLGVAVVLSGSAGWRLWGGHWSTAVAVAPATTAAPAMLSGAPPRQVPAEPEAAGARDVGAQVTPRRPVAERREPVAAQRRPTSPGVGGVVGVVTLKAPVPVEARPAPESATVDNKVFALSELPEEIRRELPALTISGAIYSENISNRFLIINGQIVHETEAPVPGVVLQTIKLKSAVLSFKGFRYSVTY